MFKRMLCPALLASPLSCLADWGENWGRMIWGQQAAAVPTLGPAGIALLALACIALGIAIRHYGVKRTAPCLVAMLVPFLAVVTNAGPGNGMLIEFENGTVADAVEVNENFALLDSRIAIAAPRFADANGQEIGPMVHLNNRTYARVSVSGQPKLATVFFEQDSVTLEPLTRFDEFRVRFSNADCTGSAYFPKGWLDDIVIFKSAAGDWYGKSGTGTNLTVESTLEFDGTCIPGSVPLTGEQVVSDIVPFDDSQLQPPFTLIY